MTMCWTRADDWWIVKLLLNKFKKMNSWQYFSGLQLCGAKPILVHTCFYIQLIKFKLKPSLFINFLKLVMHHHISPVLCVFLSCRCPGTGLPVAFTEWHKQHQPGDVAAADLHIIRPERRPASDRVYTACSSLGQHQRCPSQLQPAQPSHSRQAGASWTQPR